MGIRNVILGTTDYSDGEVFYALDHNDTNDRIIDTYKEVLDQKYGDSVLTGCEVTEQGTPDQTVAVSAGKVLINGLYYDVSADAVLNLSAADGSNPRWDLISVDSADTITITEGTAAASPVMPTLPTDNVPLASIYRNTSDNVIGTADIKDGRRLIDLGFWEKNNTIATNTSSSYNTFKTITVPAFRCQKYIDIEFDISGYMTNVLCNVSGSAFNISIKLFVNGVEEEINSARFYAEDSGGDFVNMCTTHVAKIRLLSTDHDFTKPIILRIDGLGQFFSGLGGRVACTNHTYEVKGE